MVDRQVTVTAALKDLFSRPADEIAKSLRAMEDRAFSAAKRLPVVGGALRAVEAASVKGRAVVQQFGAVLEGLGRTRTIQAIQRAGRAIGDVGARSISIIQRLTRSVFNLRSLLIGLGASFLIRGAVGLAAGVEQQTFEIGSLLGDISREELGKLNQQIRQVAVEGGQSFEREFKAAYDAISAGVPARQLLSFLRSANRLAVAGVTDVGTSVDLLTSILNAYGKSAEEADAVSDALFKTVEGGKTTVEELGRSVFQVAPAAASAGVSIEDVGAALATITAQGFPTKVAATNLRQAFVELGKSGTIAFKEFREESGLAFREFIANGGTLIEAVEILQRRAANTGRAVSDLFSGVEGGLAIQALASGIRTFAANTERLNNAAGATQKAFDLLSSTFRFNFARFRAAFQDLVVELTNVVLPSLTSTFGTIGDVVNGITNIIRGAPEARAELVATLTGFARDAVGVMRTAGVSVGRIIGATAVAVFEAGLTALGPVIADVLGDAIAAVTGGFLGQRSQSTAVRQLRAELDRVEQQLQQNDSRSDVLLAQFRATGERPTETREQSRIVSARSFAALGARDFAPLSAIEERFEAEVDLLEEAQQEWDTLQRERTRIIGELDAREDELAQQRALRQAEFLRVTEQQLGTLSDTFREESATIEQALGSLEDRAKGFADTAREAASDVVEAFTDEQILDSIEQIGKLAERVQSGLASQAAQVSARFGDSIEELRQTLTDARQEALETVRSIIEGQRLDLAGDPAFGSIADAARVVRERTRLELEAREADAAGRQRQAAAIRQEIAQAEELLEVTEALLASKLSIAEVNELLARVGAVQGAERQRLALDTRVAEINETIAEQLQRLRDLREDLDRSVEEGNLSRRAAARVARDEAQALLEVADAARVELAALRESNPEFARLLDDAIRNLDRTRADLRTQGLEGGRTFGQGLNAGFRSVFDGFRDAFEAGKALASDLARTLDSSLSRAIGDVVAGVQSAGDAFREFAADVFADLGRLLIRFTLLNALSKAFADNGGGGGGGVITGIGNFLGGLLGFAEGGVIPGRARGPGDNLVIRARSGEFIVPEPAVQAYGLSFLEAVRRRTIPRAVAASMALGSVAVPVGRGFVQGGPVGAASGARAQVTPAVVVGSQVTMQQLLSSGGDELMRFLRGRRIELSAITESARS